MASSQKHPGKFQVPWFNTNEWKYVYELIFNESTTYASKLHALELLQMWKIRTPRLPSGVEGTLIILDAVLYDNPNTSEENLRILYGAAIMRFLNLCGASGEKQGTFYRTAKQNNLPDWLIDLRHNIAHDQIVPSIDMLEFGLKVCLDWLKHEYWEKQAATITDYVICLNHDRRIVAAVELYCQINLIQYLRESKRLVELDNPSLMEKFKTIEDIVVIDVNMNIASVLALLLKTLSCYITTENINGALVSEAIIHTGSMFSREVFKVSNAETIPNNFVRIWEPLLSLLHEKNILIAFIKELVDITSSCTLDKTKKKIASFWLAEILKGLVLTKDIYDKYHELPNQHQLDKEIATVILRETIQNETPDLKQVLNFDIKYYEDIKKDLDTVTWNIIKDANVFTLRLREYIFKLHGLSDCHANHLKDLVKKYAHLSVNETRLEDHPHLLKDSIQSIPNIEEILFGGDTQLLTNMNECSNINGSDEYDPREIYKRVKDTSIFKGRSLGILKDQDINSNPLWSSE